MASRNEHLILFMAGDVMPGRGIDQVLPHSVDPRLHEPYVKDARQYVAIAEEVNGAIPAPVSCRYLWGDSLPVLEKIAPDVRIINLETSVTTSDEHWPGKGIHYRMHPENAVCLSEAGIDFCSLANNHVLDWGYAGLEETLVTLTGAGIRFGGAGRDQDQARAPAIMEMKDGSRVIVFSWGDPSSGIPERWAAGKDRPGVNLLDSLSADSVSQIRQTIAEYKRRGDIVVVSIHWGNNWGYAVPRRQVDIAHQLIDEAGVDVIHGHSSHHPKPLEVYNDRLIIYGAGDFLNDYEGISGHEQYRPELTLMYFVHVDPMTGELARLRMVPMEIRQFSLKRASPGDVSWLQETLNRESRRFGVEIQLAEDNTLVVDHGARK